jgi:phosphohistidine phosphatase
VKRLTLVRHGNAEWKDAKMADFQRPLNRRGAKEADSIACRMLEMDWIPDLVIASSAERTRTTADILSKVLSPKRTQFEERLYLAPADEILNVVRATGPLVTHLMLVGHNPGISEAAKMLARNDDIDELGTACACSVVFKVRSWTEIGPDKVIESTYEAPSILVKLWA